MGINQGVHVPRWPADFVRVPADEHGRAVCYRCATRGAIESLRNDNRQLDTVEPYVARWRAVVLSDTRKPPPAFEPYWITAKQDGRGDGDSRAGRVGQGERWRVSCKACDVCLRRDPSMVMSMEHHPAGWAASWPDCPDCPDEEPPPLDARKALVEPLVRRLVLDVLTALAGPVGSVALPAPSGATLAPMRPWWGTFGSGEAERGKVTMDLPTDLPTEFRAFGRIVYNGASPYERCNELAFSSAGGGRAAFVGTGIHTEQVVTFTATSASAARLEGTYASTSPDEGGWFRLDTKV